MEKTWQYVVGTIIKDRSSVQRLFMWIKNSRMILTMFSFLVVFLLTSLIFAESDDALFIDNDGNVSIGKNLNVNENLGVSRNVKAKKFEGDGSAITVGGVEFVKQVEGNPPLSLEEVVRAIIADMVPIGTIMAFGGDVKDEKIKKKLEAQGWLACDGSPIETNGDYKDLYAVIGNAFGGDANNFYLPDMRGQFLRGVDYLKENEKRELRDPDVNDRKHAISGKIVGAKVGSVQKDELRKHKHQVESWGDQLGGDLRDAQKNTAFRDYAFTGGDGTIKNSTKTSAIMDYGGNETRPKSMS